MRSMPEHVAVQQICSFTEHTWLAHFTSFIFSAVFLLELYKIVDACQRRQTCITLKNKCINEYFIYILYICTYVFQLADREEMYCIFLYIGEMCY